MTLPTVIELTEFKSTELPPEALLVDEARQLRDRYGKQVEVRPPNQFDEFWTLRPLGWVGHIPLSPRVEISLRPKVPLENLFRMLEYAYDTEFHFLEGLTACRSLTEFYERLANVLAQRVVARARRGFYREYVPKEEQLNYVRGRLDLRRTIRAPWEVHLDCQYEEHTGNIEDNQILAWTLHMIARSGHCSERVLPTVRRAYRSLQSFVDVVPCSVQQCLNRLYHRLNSDYGPLHALCRFFLEHTGPSHQLGDKTMLPFLIEMSHLFEKFVAVWLGDHLPAPYAVKAQERVEISDGVLRFDIDLVLYDSAKNTVVCVLDTKYKEMAEPSNADFNQVAVYALLKKCKNAVLIYPTAQSGFFDETVDSIRVRSASFDIGGDLDCAGDELLSQLELP